MALTLVGGVIGISNVEIEARAIEVVAIGAEVIKVKAEAIEVKVIELLGGAIKIKTGVKIAKKKTTTKRFRYHS